MKSCPIPSTPGRPWWLWPVRGTLCLASLLGVWFIAGCNPASLTMLLLPFTDDKEPPKFKLATRDKEVTLAIVAWFGDRNLSLSPDTLPADSELAESLAAILRDRYALNKDKVKIVANAQVRSYQNSLADHVLLPVEVGKRAKADKVIALEIRGLSLYEKSTQRAQQLFRGNADILITVYDLDKTGSEQVAFTPEFYKRSFPGESPYMGDCNVDQFRALYLTRVARDVSRLFAAYDSKERMYNSDMEGATLR